MLKIDPEVLAKKDSLERRRRSYRKFSIPSQAIWIIGLLLAFIVFLTGAREENLYALLSLIPMFGGVIVSFVLDRLAKPYEFSTQERVFLAIISALEDLTAYINDHREPDRKRAEKKIDEISKSIEGIRTKLAFIKKTVNPHLDPFKEAFYRKVVGAVRQRERETSDQLIKS
jgi:hypothetical protein